MPFAPEDSSSLYKIAPDAVFPPRAVMSSKASVMMDSDMNGANSSEMPATIVSVNTLSTS